MKKSKEQTSLLKMFWLTGAAAVLLLVTAVIIIIFPDVLPDFNRNKENLQEDNEIVVSDILKSIVVPFHPGSTADLIAHALVQETGLNVSIHNIHGANGAIGANEVFEGARDGSRVLITSLSALQDANRMGFSEHGPDDWEMWLVSYAPGIIAVRADSQLTPADLPAHLEIHHDSGAAIRAVLDGDADYVVALSTVLVHLLNSGELRELAQIEGDWYGVMLPKDTPKELLRAHEEFWRDAVANEGFELSK